MRINVNKDIFIKSWTLAEHSAGTSSSMNIFSTIQVRADDNGVELKATDIKTSIVCSAKGVTVIEPGEAVIPIKGVSDLFKKAGSDEFTLTIDEGKAIMASGSGRYKFSTYPSQDFPKLPSSEGGNSLCELPIADLIQAIDRGSLCASTGDEYPQFLSSVYFEVENDVMNVVSTDKRRLALSRVSVSNTGVLAPILLPMKGLKELQRVLGMLGPDMTVRISYDDSQTYFTTDGMEFAIRRIETKFPPYAKILPTSRRTTANVDRFGLVSALERVDVVVRDYNRAVLIQLSGEGECTLSGRALEFGEAVEHLTCEIEGEPVTLAVNSRFLLDALKALAEPTASLLFNGEDGHMLVRDRDSDSFLCLVAPLEFDKGEIASRAAPTPYSDKFGQ